MAARKRKLFAEDPEAIRTEAAHLLSLRIHDVPMQWTDWELDFLEGMARRTTDEPLTDAQVAKFDQLRRLSELRSGIDGLSIALLVAGCASEADYLDEDDDREFIRDLQLSKASQLRWRDAGRLLRCCREVEIIDSHHPS